MIKSIQRNQVIKTPDHRNTVLAMTTWYMDPFQNGLTIRRFPHADHSSPKIRSRVFDLYRYRFTLISVTLPDFTSTHFISPQYRCRIRCGSCLGCRKNLILELDGNKRSAKGSFEQSTYCVLWTRYCPPLRKTLVHICYPTVIMWLQSLHTK